jgi:hypothetical protein
VRRGRIRWRAEMGEKDERRRRRWGEVVIGEDAED